MIEHYPVVIIGLKVLSTDCTAGNAYGLLIFVPFKFRSDIKQWGRSTLHELLPPFTRGFKAQFLRDAISCNVLLVLFVSEINLRDAKCNYANLSVCVRRSRSYYRVRNT